MKLSGSQVDDMSHEQALSLISSSYMIQKYRKIVDLEPSNIRKFKNILDFDTDCLRHISSFLFKLVIFVS